MKLFLKKFLLLVALFTSFSNIVKLEGGVQSTSRIIECFNYLWGISRLSCLENAIKEHPLKVIIAGYIIYNFGKSICCKIAGSKQIEEDNSPDATLYENEDDENEDDEQIESLPKS